MKVGLIQQQVIGGDLEGNRERASAGISKAADKQVDLIVLPELFRVGYFAADQFEAAAEGLQGPTLTWLADRAATTETAILAGSIVEDLEQTAERTPAETGYANTSVLFDAEGNRVAIYRKHHLFGYESKGRAFFTPGERLAVAEIENHRVGITTCYDLRFPELYRRLVDRGVTVFLVPSAWPYPRVEHWRTLTRARAIENLAYVVAVNGVGPAGGDGLIGRSRVIDPWGMTVGAAGSTSDHFVATIESERVTRIREDFPALRDRRR